jgi:hypothetical protein
MLGVFTGSTIGSLEDVADESSPCANPNLSGIEFFADGTEPIRIAVAGGTLNPPFEPEEGEFTLEIEQIFRPPNDDFEDALAMSGTTASSAGTTPNASAQPNEPTAQPDNTNSNWHSWTAPSTGEYRLSTCGSEALTFLAVYTGTALLDLEEKQVDFNGAYCGPTDEDFGAKLIFDAQEGTTYWFQVLSLEDDLEGAYTLSLSPSGPPNDAPDTSILDVTVKKRTATAEFTGTDEDEITFECNLDGKGWKDCVSPQKFKRLKPGQHELAVRAIDEDGKLDRSPATDTFKVKKKRS